MRKVLCGIALLWAGVAAAQNQSPPKDLTVGVGKSLVVDSPVDVHRVSVGNPDVLEAVGVSEREVLVSGKSAGETTLIVWQEGGNRLQFDVIVRQPNTRLEAVKLELARELPGQDVTFTVDKDVVFLHGTVTDLTSAGRAVAITSALGKTVNLLHVNVPPSDQQILLKVRFANVDRSIGSQLGFNLFSTGATNTVGALSTGQFNPPSASLQGSGKSTQSGISLSDALNLFLYRPDLNLGATIQALQTNNLLEILAEPNLLALNGKEASFLAGGEFPYPTVQGGSAGGVVAITIQFREFGIKLHFTPTVTPRGTIHLKVAPEVSSLDFANGLVYQGFSIPALDTRKMQTEIELESGQSFAIAGLLDNQVSETLSKVPGLGDIPILGKLFQSRLLNRSKTELLVIVTPELVRPIAAGQPKPSVDLPKDFMKEGPQKPPSTPGQDVTGPVPVKLPRETMPVEELLEQQRQGQESSAPAATQAPLFPIPVTPAAPAQP
jgi:pilus assembly protein CpaC